MELMDRARQEYRAHAGRGLTTTSAPFFPQFPCCGCPASRRCFAPFGASPVKLPGRVARIVSKVSLSLPFVLQSRAFLRLVGCGDVGLWNQLSDGDPGEDQDGAGGRTDAQALTSEKERGDPGKHRFHRQNERDVRGRENGL